MSSCPDYRVQEYTLVVEDSRGQRTNATSQATGGIVDIAIGGLPEDTPHSYHVLAINQIGNSNPSTLVEISE